MSSIEIKNVSKSYGHKKVLNDISVTFEEGKIYGLLGRNGAGKTTLLNLITNKVFFKEGEIKVDGDSTCENDKALSKIYFMCEKDYLPADSKVSEIIKWTAEFYNMFNLDYAMKLVEDFELSINSKYEGLSTGYKSICKIILCLASGAEILIFDEPVLGLDANHRELFYKELLKHYGETEQTIIISTHIIEEIADMLEKVVIINNGKVIKDDYVEALLNQAYAISGKADIVDSYINNKNCIAVESLGAFKKATILEEQTIENSREIEKLGLEISNVELQKLFINLTNREGK